MERPFLSFLTSKAITLCLKKREGVLKTARPRLLVLNPIKRGKACVNRVHNNYAFVNVEN